MTRANINLNKELVLALWHKRFRRQITKIKQLFGGKDLSGLSSDTNNMENDQRWLCTLMAYREF